VFISFAFLTFFPLGLLAATSAAAAAAISCDACDSASRVSLLTRLDRRDSWLSAKLSGELALELSLEDRSMLGVLDS
jgi:hypothetical protein